MRSATAVLALFILLLGGCDFVDILLPRYATTSADVRLQLERCTIESDSIAWTVGEDGTFAFGRKGGNAAPMTEAKSDCLMQWVTDNRVKIAFIGWEKSPQ